MNHAHFKAVMRKGLTYQKALEGLRNNLRYIKILGIWTVFGFLPYHMQNLQPWEQPSCNGWFSNWTGSRQPWLPPSPSGLGWWRLPCSRHQNIEAHGRGGGREPSPYPSYHYFSIIVTTSGHWTLTKALEIFLHRHKLLVISGLGQGDVFWERVYFPENCKANRGEKLGQGVASEKGIFISPSSIGPPTGGEENASYDQSVSCIS